MPDDIDTALSYAIHLAASAAHPLGPASARARGTQRAVRKRIIISALSAALVLGGTGAAFAIGQSTRSIAVHVAASDTAKPTASAATSQPTGVSTPSSTWFVLPGRSELSRPGETYTLVASVLTQAGYTVSETMVISSAPSGTVLDIRDAPGLTSGQSELDQVVSVNTHLYVIVSGPDPAATASSAGTH